MAYFSRRIVEEAPKVETEVWACVSEACRGWMRKDFSFVAEPECPICATAMVNEVRMLPQMET